MGARWKNVVAAVLVAVAVAGLAGCLRITADNLYSLPEVSEQYLRLQRRIDSILGLNAEFSPPTGGMNRQAVQLKDLDGDGVDEVIAFFTLPDSSSLSVYIFSMLGEDFVVEVMIEGIGTRIESVRYVDMDGDGIVEVVLGWEMDTALKYMSIYSIKGFQSVLLAQAEYSAIKVFDMNGDGFDEVIALRLPTMESGATAKVFMLMQDGEIISEEARLSSNVNAIQRVSVGRLVDNVPAIFVDCEGKFENGSFVTDILVYQDESFSNISCKDPSGISEETLRSRMQSQDINKDGIIEVPIPRRLKSLSETAYYAIDWYAFDSFGMSRLALTTYHNNYDEWYLIMPSSWRGKVSVRREDAVSGERTVIFSYIAGNDGPYDDFLKIYKLYGDRREERAKLPGRTILMSEGATIYAFELLPTPENSGIQVDQALIKENFKLIYSDWLSGVV